MILWGVGGVNLDPHPLNFGFWFFSMFEFPNLNFMVEIEMINTIRQSFNRFYDIMVEENANNDNIGLKEFQYRMRIIENSRVTLNEEFDFVIMMLIRRDMEQGEGV